MNLWCIRYYSLRNKQHIFCSFLYFLLGKRLHSLPYQITIYTEDVSLHDHPKWYH